MAGRYPELLSLGYVVPGPMNSDENKEQMSNNVPVTNPLDASSKPDPDCPSAQLMSRNYDDEQKPDNVNISANLPSISKEYVQPSQHRFPSRQQVISHSPVMKELIEKFEMRKAENKNSVRLGMRQEGEGVSLMARDAWGPSHNVTADLDIDPAAVTSSSFSDISDSRHISPTGKPSFARSSIAAMTLNEKQVGDGSVVANTNLVAGDEGRSGDIYSQYRKSMVSAGIGRSRDNKADNQTNNKDFDFAKDSTIGKLSGASQMLTTNAHFQLNSVSQNPVVENVLGDSRVGEGISNEEESANQSSDGQSPMRVSLRGIVRKQASQGFHDGRANALNRNAQKVSHLKPNKQKGPTPTHPGMLHESSHRSKSSIASSNSPSKVPRQVQQKNNISATISQIPVPFIHVKDSATKNDSLRSSTSISKQSVIDDTSKTRKSDSAMGNTSDFPKNRKLSSTDRYLMFLKRTTPPPEPAASHDSLKLATQQVTQIINTPTPLIHKPPKRESSINRQGSNLTGKSKDVGYRDRIEKEEVFKINAPRRLTEAEAHHSGARPKRPINITSRKRPQSEPNRILSSMSIGISSSGSQASGPGEGVKKWSSNKASETSLIAPKYQRLPARDNTPKAGSSESAMAIISQMHTSESWDHGQYQRTKNLERHLKSANQVKPSECGMLSTTSLVSPNLGLMPPSKSNGLPYPVSDDADLTRTPGKNVKEVNIVVGGRGIGSGDKMSKTFDLQDIDNPLNLLTDIEMADTNLIPKHLREKKPQQSHQPLATHRDDYVLLLTSSDEDSSYLSIEDQLKKIKAKRLLQMLKGSTLVEPITSYHLSTNDVKQQTSGRLTPKSKDDVYVYPKSKVLHGNDYVGCYRGTSLMSDLRGYPEQKAFSPTFNTSLPRRCDRASVNEPVQSKASSPEVLQFTSNPLDRVLAKDLEDRTGGVVAMPSPVRAFMGGDEHVQKVSKSDGKRIHSRDLSSPRVEGHVHADDQLAYHFGCVRGGSIVERSHSRSPEKVMSDMYEIEGTGRTSPHKPDRPKKRRIDATKLVRKKRRKQAGDMEDDKETKKETKLIWSSKKKKNQQPLHNISPCEAAKKSKTPRGDNDQQNEDMELFTPLNVSHLSPKMPVGQLKVKSPSTDFLADLDESQSYLAGDKWKDYYVWGQHKPARRLSCGPTARWPIHSRIPLLDVKSPVGAPVSAGDVWAKYRRLKEDFKESGHPCKIPLSGTFRYMLKIAPFQEFKLHRWNPLEGRYALDSDTRKTSVESGHFSMDFDGCSMQFKDIQNDPPITFATKFRYWRRGPVRMPHVLYMTMGATSVFLAYLIMWLVTCRGNNFDMFCNEDDVSCLVKHIAGNSKSLAHIT